MQVALFKHAIGNAPLLGTRTYDCASRFNRLFHHVANRACAQHIAFTGHIGHFDGQQFTAHLCPGQTSNQANLVLFFGQAKGETTYAQVIVQIRRIHDQSFLGQCLVASRTRTGLWIGHQQLANHLAADLADFTFQRTHTRFTCVVPHDVAYRVFCHFQLTLAHAVVLHQLGQEVIERNAYLLVFGIAGQTNHFHTVQQGRWNVQGVAGCHEHHIGQVVVHFQVVILEGVVLFGVQNLQQCRGWIATEIRAHLVDLVQQEQRVTYTHLAHVLNNLAGHGADVGTTVTANLGLVTHATQSHANELAVRCLGDGLTQRGLTHAWRANQTQNRSLQLIDALLHSQVLDNALFDLFQTKVIRIQYFLGVAQGVVDTALFAPRQAYQRFDVVAHDRGFG